MFGKNESCNIGGRYIEKGRGKEYFIEIFDPCFLRYSPQWRLMC